MNEALFKICLCTSLTVTAVNLVVWLCFFSTGPDWPVPWRLHVSGLPSPAWAFLLQRPGQWKLQLFFIKHSSCCLSLSPSSALCSLSHLALKLICLKFCDYDPQSVKCLTSWMSVNQRSKLINNLTQKSEWRIAAFGIFSKPQYQAYISLTRWSH